MANYLLKSDIYAIAMDKFGGARQDRTADLVTASHALSQLSYSPNSGGKSYLFNPNHSTGKF